MRSPPRHPAASRRRLTPAARRTLPPPSPPAVAASGKPFASKPMELWSKHDVADWLESLNLGEHRDAFLDNEIEGAHLPSLQKEDLIDLGVTRVGHRMNIERALKLLVHLNNNNVLLIYHHFLSSLIESVVIRSHFVSEYGKFKLRNTFHVFRKTCEGSTH
uniref:SAM domain-containing protein n=1 Tax=Amphiprion percula TaxID=161767 RepID=A0A3P8RJE9_AMPPE